MPILNWLTRDSDIGAAKRVPYRLLQEAPELSAGDPDAPNMLIQGDNPEALNALLPFYAGQVKCIYIDPPYGTTSKSSWTRFLGGVRSSQISSGKNGHPARIARLSLKRMIIY